MNVRTGKEGWFKRVQRNVAAVERQVQLNDDVAIDTTGEASMKMYQAAKQAICGKKTKAISIDDCGKQSTTAPTSTEGWMSIFFRCF